MTGLHIEATKPIIAILLDSSELDVRNTNNPET